MKIRREDLCEFMRAWRKVNSRGRHSVEDWERYIEAGKRIGDAVDLCRDAMKIEKIRGVDTMTPMREIGVDVLCDILRMLGVEVE